MKTKPIPKKFMILFFVIAIITRFCNGTFAQIKFEHGTWSEIKAKAKAENKFIFMDAFTSWCGPCKWMAANIFTNDTVANYYNSTFVNAKIDMEVGEGKDIATLYSVNVYPSLLFIDANGELVHRAAGSRGTSEFIQLGKDAQIPEKQFGNLNKKYKKGQRDTQFMKTYLAALQSTNLKTTEPLAAYFNTQKEEDLISCDNWSVIYKYVTDYKSKEFNYLLKNTDAYSKKYTTDSVNNKIYYVFMDECYRLIYSKDTDSAKYFQLKGEIKKSGFVRSEELFLESDIAYYQKKLDFENFAKVVSVYIEKYKYNDANSLNGFSYQFYESVKDKAMLAKSEQWAKKAYELEPHPQYTMDTYACVLSVNGKKQEAIKLEKQAIEIIKADPKKYDQSVIADMEKKITDWSKK